MAADIRGKTFYAFMQLGLVLALLCLVSGCTTSEAFEEDSLEAEYGIVEQTAYDPIEPFNRAIFTFNEYADRWVLKPVAKGYRNVVPELAREGVHNVLTNLTEPLVFTNSLLQLDSERAFTSFWRFTLNSTFGILGLRDFAGEVGLKYRDEDFGQTLGSYGMGPGPYLVLPLLGPSNARDLLGTVTDYVLDPVNYGPDDEWLLGEGLVGAVDTRERLLEVIDDIYETSLDPYTTFRSGYLQRRKDAIANGNGRKSDE